jgi:Right handed beta helix region
MPTSPRHRRAAIAAAVVGVLVLLAPLLLLIHGSDPAGGTATATAPRPQTRDPRLAGGCVSVAHDGDQLAQRYAAAKPGQTVCLATGDYGKFIAGHKNGVVGIRAQRGAKATMALALDSVDDLRIDGVIIKTAVISGTSRNITIANSRFTGLAAVLTDQMINANILFEHNVHADVNTCLECYQGRLHVEGHSGRPTGVVIRDSVFSGGNSDGVRADANGIKIIGNEFFGLRDRDPFHTDPIQIYGGNDVLIRGNYFHDNDVSAQIMMADGGAHNTVEDNVVAGGGYTWALTWFSDRDSTIRHNTFSPDGACDDLGCGVLNLGAKAQDPAGRGTIIRDNVMGGISNHGEAKVSGFAADHNLTASPIDGAGNIVGLPRFRGPLGSYSGYRMAPGSLGSDAGSDGTSPGIR